MAVCCSRPSSCPVISAAEREADRRTDDDRTIADLNTFLRRWFDAYPAFQVRASGRHAAHTVCARDHAGLDRLELRDERAASRPALLLQPNDFFISGESFAGVYVPLLSQAVLDGNDAGQEPQLRLRGYLVRGAWCGGWGAWGMGSRCLLAGTELLLRPSPQALPPACPPSHSLPPRLCSCTTGGQRRDRPHLRWRRARAFRVRQEPHQVGRDCWAAGHELCANRVCSAPTPQASRDINTHSCAPLRSRELYEEASSACGGAYWNATAGSRCDRALDSVYAASESLLCCLRSHLCACAAACVSLRIGAAAPAC